jgi:hypothetical protein
LYITRIEHQALDSAFRIGVLHLVVERATSDRLDDGSANASKRDAFRDSTELPFDLVGPKIAACAAAAQMVTTWPRTRRVYRPIWLVENPSVPDCGHIPAWEAAEQFKTILLDWCSTY